MLPLRPVKKLAPHRPMPKSHPYRLKSVAHFRAVSGFQFGRPSGTVHDGYQVEILAIDRISLCGLEGEDVPTHS